MQTKWVQATTYIGAGVGIVVFVLFGLLPGSFLGGAIGLSLSGKIFGTPLASQLFSKIIVAASMAFGAFFSAVAIVFICAALGRCAGSSLGLLFHADSAPAATIHLRSKK